MAALLALASSLMWGTADFLGGLASRRLPALAVYGLSQAVGFLVLVPVCAVELGGWQWLRAHVPPGHLRWDGGLGWQAVVPDLAKENKDQMSVWSVKDGVLACSGSPVITAAGIIPPMKEKHRQAR